MSRSRAYRHPVSPQETAARIARSIQAHAAVGVVRPAEAYTARPEVLALVAALLTPTEKDTTYAALRD